MFGLAYAIALAEEYGDKIYVNMFSTRLHDLIRNIAHTLRREPRSRTKNRIKYLNCYKKLYELTGPLSFFHALILEVFLVWGIVIKHNLTQRTAQDFCKDSENGYFGSFALSDALSFYPHGNCNKKNKYVFGPPSSDKYFYSISERIREDFKIYEPQSSENTQLMHEIKECNAVCLHIRRGDYADYPFFEVCTEEYYHTCVNYIKKRVENPVFYVFSNNSSEIRYIKSHYGFEGDFKYVDLNNQDYEELRLMYSCKHFIISNSTFSWWASFLSDNPKKIILAPDKWYDYDGPLEKWLLSYNGVIDIYRDDIIKIPVHLEEEQP